MKKTLLLMASLFCVWTVRATQPTVSVQALLQADNSLLFDAQITGHGTITVEIIFSALENCVPDDDPGERFTTSMDGSGGFLRLRPEDSSRPVVAEFTYNWLQGRLDANVDRDFVYRLPLAEGMATTPRSLTTMEMGIYRPNYVGFRVWQFPMQRGDAVYPVRAGKVIRTEGFHEPGGDEQAMMISPDNVIFIEHADGAISEYNILAWDSLRVKEGDSVDPDTPIARAGNITREDYGVNVGIYRFVTNRNSRFPGVMMQREYLDPVFMTTSGNRRLAEGVEVVGAVTKKLIDKEKKRPNLWRRLFGNRKN